MRKFKRVAMSGNRDGYFAIVEDEFEHWYGPYPTPEKAVKEGKFIEEHGHNAPQFEHERMIFK